MTSKILVRGLNYHYWHLQWYFGIDICFNNDFDIIIYEIFTKTQSTTATIDLYPSVALVRQRIITEGEKINGVAYEREKGFLTNEYIIAIIIIIIIIIIRNYY